MKDLHVERAVIDGWTPRSLQARNEHAFRTAALRTARSTTVRTVLAGMIPLLWLIEPLRSVASSNGAIGIPLFLASVAGGFYSFPRLLQLSAYYRRAEQTLHMPSARSNDPHGAADAVDGLLEELRAAPRHQGRLTRRYEDAVGRLQKLLPDEPLHSLVRRGYYPSRPVVYENGQGTYLNKDSAKDHVHWDRMSVAAADLRTILKSSNLVTHQAVRQAVSELIPPLRAVLRLHGVATHRIEYLPAKPEIAQTPEEAPAALPAPTEHSEPEPMPDDALTPVEDRLNASATMTISAIRTLELSLRAAEDDLFMGDDLETARRLMTQHVPSLVRSYVVAHDTTQGEERDQVRAEFAQALVIVRDTLSGIMRRHAQEARRRMEDETRFLRMRHGEDPLFPPDDAITS